MSTSDAVDTLLDHLLAATEALRDSTRTRASEQAGGLLARRRQIVSALTSALGSEAPASSLTQPQRRKLERAVQLGEDTRQALLIQRETSRGELHDALASRQLNESFKPYRPKRPGGLNINL